MTEIILGALEAFIGLLGSLGIDVEAIIGGLIETIIGLLG